MSRFRLSPLAQTDLEDIWDYTFKRWDGDQAEHYVQQIRQTIEQLAGMPKLGRVCDDVREGYRKYPVGSHIVFFRVRPDHIDVIRILHNRMDIDRHL